MSFYKCGHNRKMVFLDYNPVSFSSYLRWKDTVGFDGNKSQCFNCFCKNLNKMSGGGLTHRQAQAVEDEGSVEEQATPLPPTPDTKKEKNNATK